jgi:hypothetical protein
MYFHFQTAVTRFTTRFCFTDDHLDSSLRIVVCDLDGPDEVSSLTEVGILDPVDGVYLQPVPFETQNLPEQEGLGTNQLNEFGLGPNLNLELGFSQLVGLRLLGQVGQNSGGQVTLLVTVQCVREESKRDELLLIIKL